MNTDKRLKFKNECDNILRYGHIIDDTEKIVFNLNFRFYTIFYNNTYYKLTKVNGLWFAMEKFIIEE